MKRTYTLTPEMNAALGTTPADYIASWWKANATAEEQAQAVERGATAGGALAFVESVARKKCGGGNACLPDALTYQLAAIFLRNGADGDEFCTSEELKAAEEAEAKRKAQAEERKAKAKKRNAERKAKLTPAEQSAEAKAEAEREIKTEAEEVEREALEAARLAKLARVERAKAIQKEMKMQQLEFNFGC